MKRKRSWARLLANALTLSMAAGSCLPAVTVSAAEGNAWAVVEGLEDTQRSQSVSDGTVQQELARTEEATYVLMNIPYDDFYRAEITNNVKVDAFTSATLNKTRTNNAVMAQGSYHVDPAGSDITGITYPVKLGEGVSLEDLAGYKKVLPTDSVSITVTNRGTTTTQVYEGKDALFENPSYSYYQLDEVPAYYKEVTVGADGRLVFGKDMSTRSVSGGVQAELLTKTSYGDHQMNLDGLDLGGATVFGVALETEDGRGYGLRHLENMWGQTQLAWCTGFTAKVHNCPTSSEHYANTMGKRIKKAVYYTSNGIIEIPLDVYVPEKFAHTLEVADSRAASGSAAFTLSGLPADYDARYSVDGLAVQVLGDRLTFADARKGRYTLDITDAGGRYAPLSTTFILYTEDMPAAYDPAQKALVAANGLDAAAFADYLENITSVSVDGTSYAASGRGAVVIIGENGAVKTDAAPLEGKESCSMEVTSTGYLPLTFTYSSAVNINTVDTAGLQRSIQAAEKIKKSAYTAASYAKLEKALKTAKDVLAGAESQEAADQAAKQLDAAVRALVKARPKPGTVITYGNVKYQVINSSAVRAQKAKNTSVTTASIPATVTIDGYKYKVTAIADKAFANCRKLKAVQIQANVASIGNSAFSGCRALKKVSLSSTALTTIGGSAFSGCTALTSFTASSAKLASIGKKAFSGDKKLAAVSLKTAKLTKAKVGAGAFKNIKSTCTFKVPAKKVASYKAIFTAKGAGRKIRVKKL